MIRLYQGPGSGEIELLGKHLQPEKWNGIREAATKLLRARRHTLAADLLDKIPFELHDGTNWFGDEYTVLHATAPLERYVKIAELKAKPELPAAAKALQAVFEELGLYVRFIAVSLEQIQGVEPVPTPSPLSASASVKRALEDAAQLLGSAGAVSAVDRLHTALHGYLRSACQSAGLAISGDESLASLFRVLRRGHPAFQEPGPREDDVARVGNGIATILDALGPLRNRASVAHANDELLEEPEAMLVINSAKTLFHYIDAKTRH